MRDYGEKACGIFDSHGVFRIAAIGDNNAARHAGMKDAASATAVTLAVE
jgi:hypothetical protein